jgi:hypothetical protein
MEHPRTKHYIKYKPIYDTKALITKIGKNCEACKAIISRKSVKYQKLKPVLGLTMSEQEDEYQYFHVFTEKTEDLTARKKYCPWDSSLTLEDCCALMTSTLELADITLSRSHDIDGIRGKAAEILICLSLYCQRHEKLKYILPTDPLAAPAQNTIQDMAAHLTKLCTSLTDYEMPTCYYPHIENPDEEAQSTIYKFAAELLGISGLNDIHELMSLAIQLKCDDTIFKQRLKHIHRLDYNKKRYESLSIYPWKYYWIPKAREVLTLMAGCTQVTLGKSYYFSEMVQMFCDVFLHKIYEHGENDEEILKLVSHVLDFEPEYIDLKNPRTLQYPLMKFVTPATFDETWLEKYPRELQLTRKLRKELYGFKNALWCKPNLAQHALQKHDVDESSRFTLVDDSARTNTPEPGTRLVTPPWR